MKRQNYITRQSTLTAILIILLPTSAFGADDTVILQQQIEVLQRQIKEIQEQLHQQEISRKEIRTPRTETSKTAEAQTKRHEPSSIAHLSGYASVGYTDNENAKGRFSQVQFSPIFHYQYKDLMLLESELEIKNEADGSTDTELEYLTLNLFLNDYVAVSTGKFLSPIGQFRQNLHPGWINKLPSAPPGFGHDGAAPISETGIQLRGGFPIGNIGSNYAFYVGNGPELESVTEDGEIELEGIRAEGRTSDPDGKKAWGGRFALLPVPRLELAVSFASGEAIVTELDKASVASTQPLRSYDVVGADFNWQWKNLDIKGEFVKSEIGNDISSSTTASPGATWKTWYTQTAYRFTPTNVEGVIRYTDFDSAHSAEKQKQWAVGLNYLFASNVIAKIAYEENDGQVSATNDDSLLMQLSYGF